MDYPLAFKQLSFTFLATHSIHYKKTSSILVKNINTCNNVFLSSFFLRISLKQLLLLTEATTKLFTVGGEKKVKIQT